MSQNKHSVGGPVEPDFFDGMPRRIRVGSIWFDIKVVEADVMNQNGPLGITDRHTCEIVIRRTGNNSQDFNTAVHEINHAIFWSQGLEAAEDEEPIVNRMSNGLLALLYDNPDYYSWFDWAVREVTQS